MEENTEKLKIEINNLLYEGGMDNDFCMYAYKQKDLSLDRLNEMLKYYEEIEQYESCNLIKKWISEKQK